MAGDVGRGALLDDPAVLDDDQPVGQHHGVQRVVRDQDGDGLELGQVAPELGADLQAGAGVQGGQRLVEEQQPGAGGQGAGEGDALGLAAGQPARLGAGVVGEAHAVQPLGGLRAGLRLGRAVAARAEGHVVQGGEVREEQVVLEDDADRAGLRRRTVQRRAVQPQMAAGERGQPGQRAQGGGLARAVGPSSATTSPGAAVSATSSRKAPRSTTRRASRPSLGRRRHGRRAAAARRRSSIGVGHAAVIQRSRSPPAPRSTRRAAPG